MIDPFQIYTKCPRKKRFAIVKASVKSYLTEKGFVKGCLATSRVALTQC